MKFLQQPIEKKLSALIGAKVTFERLNISPLSGRLEAENMIVAGDAPDQPLLTIRRIDAQIAVTRALAGEIVVKSLVVEGPEIFLARRSDGSLNIPPRPPKFAADPDDESKPWQFEAQSIRVRDGKIRFQRNTHVAGVDGINCEFKCQDGKIDMAAIELRGKVDVDSWLSALMPALATIKFAGPVAADVQVDIVLPLYAIFPNRTG
jgi:uncharacterized protein involved in outer membrane biogenesis